MKLLGVLLLFGLGAVFLALLTGDLHVTSGKSPEDLLTKLRKNGDV